MSAWKPKPGASEVFTILMPCALTPGGKHEIKLRMRADNRVTIEGACDKRVAGAHDALTQKDFVLAFSCLSWVTLMHDAVRARAVKAFDLIRCRTCAAIVPAWRNRCPFAAAQVGIFDGHDIDRKDLPFWERIVRSGRVR